MDSWLHKYVFCFLFTFCILGNFFKQMEFNSTQLRTTKVNMFN